jgi:ribosomal protein L37AE/L43A
MRASRSRWAQRRLPAFRQSRRHHGRLCFSPKLAKKTGSIWKCEKEGKKLAACPFHAALFLKRQDCAG